MASREETNKSVIEFSQTKTRTKRFRHDYPISIEIKEELLTVVLKDFASYVVQCHYEMHQSVFKEYIDEHLQKKEKRSALEENLFWWQMIYNANLDVELSCVEDYISLNHFVLCKKPLVISWLREWDRAMPKFYYVGDKHNDRGLVLVDILKNEIIDVIVYDPLAITATKGEVVMGTLIPIGDGVYFPVIDFYHFNLETSKYIVQNLRFYYENNFKKGTMLEAFIQVLSIVLQIEEIIENEKTED